MVIVSLAAAGRYSSYPQLHPPLPHPSVSVHDPSSKTRLKRLFSLFPYPDVPPLPRKSPSGQIWGLSGEVCPTYHLTLLFFEDHRGEPSAKRLGGQRPPEGVDAARGT